MIKKYLHILLVIAIMLLACEYAFAASDFDKPDFSTTPGGSEIGKLVNNITIMAKEIHKASNKMMKFGDMLICASLHGEAADVGIDPILEIRLIDLSLFFAGGIFYILGFMVMMVASFYMFDVAFNLVISIILLPLGLSLWLFAWTKDKVGTIMENIAYYTGLFIFLPLGILLGSEVVKTVIESALSPSVWQHYEQDRSDILEQQLGMIERPFLQILLSYIIAIKIIPLMADDFCSHFFGKALVGNPMKENLSQIATMLKKHTLDKAGKFAKDVAKHQTGEAIKKAGEKMGGSNPGLLSRSIARYGAEMAQTKK